ncbi:hypothetical protein VC83_00809 [Pseudogymnoascus destructans]|uniref:Uncharacterized protein n=2 Tax=Pseudogymnoascus destructans TaxID=655981 RepID=L8FP77_PSED2|nr:uncharacterized protein VC83_00809 [Pseudogymnoascus destructans]ELR02790.1 hypothetical protein, variant [Pseudogymnoascus destructans 20631-21]OAF62382.1 hypothetical protein VC83_00809 [Pseudogymnoascus destructans]
MATMTMTMMIVQQVSPLKTKVGKTKMKMQCRTPQLQVFLNSTMFLPKSFNILPVNKPDILERIKVQHLESRGYGLPAIDRRILPVLWQKQSHNWDGITLSLMNVSLCMYTTLYIVSSASSARRPRCETPYSQFPWTTWQQSTAPPLNTSSPSPRQSTAALSSRRTRAQHGAKRDAICPPAQTQLRIPDRKTEEDCIPVKAIELSAAALAMSMSNLDSVGEDYHDVLHAGWLLSIRGSSIDTTFLVSEVPAAWVLCGRENIMHVYTRQWTMYIMGYVDVIN